MMRKIYFTFWFIVLSISVINAQGNLTPENMPPIFSRIDSLVTKYVEYSAFQIEEDRDKILPEQMDNFKSLFWEGATIYDELCPKYFDFLESKSTIPIANYEWLSGVNRTVDEYCNKRILYFERGGCGANVNNLTLSLKELSSGKVAVLIEKTVNGTWSSRDLTIRSNPVLLIELSFQNNFNDLKISSIKFAKQEDFLSNTSKSAEEKRAEKMKKPVRFVASVNPIRGYKIDDDPDFDFRVKDFAPQVPGFIEKNEGAPDEKTERNDLKLLGFNFESPWNVDLNLNYGFPQFALTQATNGLNGYDDQERWGSNALNPKMKGTSVGFDALFNIYFGLEKTFGFSSGISYSRQSGEISSTDFLVQYKDSLSELYINGLSTTQTFRRELAIRNLKEEFDINSFSLPFLIRWKPQMASPKWVVDIAGGGIFQFSSSGSTNCNAISLNYGGSVAGNPINGWIYSSDSGAYNYQFTESNLKDDVVLSFADKGFKNSFGSNILPNQTAQNFTFQGGKKGGFGWVIRPTLFYRLNENFFMGIQASYSRGAFQSSNLEASRAYRPSDAIGEYNSLFGSLERVKFQSIAASISIRYTIAN